jgi:uncharacterized protein
MSVHPIVHVEIPAINREVMGKFYAELCGWTVQQRPEMDYATFEVEGGPRGGFPTIDGKSVKPGEITVYIASSDVDATLKRANELGGKTIIDKTQIPGVGFYGVFEDPSGNRIGIFDR